MLDAYCWPQSGIAGDRIDVMVSGDTASGTLRVVRTGASEVPVLDGETVTIADQPVPDDVAVDGCRWEPTTTLRIDESWRPGFHLVQVESDDGQIAEAFVVVRRRADSTADAVLVLTTSTWAAYNDWGGPSFYTGGHHSSQLRPLPAGFLAKPEPERYRVANFGQLARDEVDWYFDRYSYWSAAAGWANWERLFVAWAENNGLELDYATSLDLATDPTMLEPYTVYLSIGHDEYWSASMRDNVEGWVDRGGTAVFLSGNTAFWQVRFEDGGERVVGYKNDYLDDPVVGTEGEPFVSTMWSDPLCGRPENEMTGVSFTRGGYAHMRGAPMGSGGYTVWRPDHAIFDGVTLRAGDLLGAEPVVVGYECDGCELELIDGRPVAAGTGGTPTNFEVLATAPAHLWATDEAAPGLPDSYIGELNWVAERLAGGDTPENRERFAYGHAVLGTFTRGRGRVFTTGCTDWAYGLTDPAVSRITANMINHTNPELMPTPAVDGKQRP